MSNDSKDNNIYEQTKDEVYVVGIDFSEDYVQISYMPVTQHEPISMSTSPDEKKYLIPTVLYRNPSTKEWSIGDRALFDSFGDSDSEQNIVRNVYNTVISKEFVNVNGSMISHEQLYKYFLKSLIALFKDIVGASEISNISMTVEKLDISFINLTREIFEEMGFDKTKVRVISHAESFIYYVINQKKELWVNDVALFDFTKEHFIYRRINDIKIKNPNILSVTEYDLSNEINYSMLETESGRIKADKKLLEFVQQELKKHIVCTAFLTGVGFYDDWASESISEICTKRRIFKGYNLFVKGACYSSMKKYNNITDVKHIFWCKGRTKASVGLLIDNNGRNMVIVLSKAGTNWYEAGAVTECILDNIDRVQLVVTLQMENISKNIIVDVSDFPSRPNKTTRIQLSLAYKDDDTFEIVVKDMGFGEFFKSSGKIVKKAIKVSELF